MRWNVGKGCTTCGVLLGGFVGFAQAADLNVGGIKNLLPDTLTYGGITIFGVIDVGYGYQTSGAPQSSGGYWGLNWNAYGGPVGRQPISALTANAFSTSMVGAKIEEEIGAGWKAIGRLETGFNPVSGTLDDACSSRIENNGKPSNVQTVNGDGGRCGQALNGSNWGGIANLSYGTLTFGRQNSLDTDVTYEYDPALLSSAFSVMGFLGGFGGGAGTTETQRWDRSAKYTYQNGPVHAGVMYAQGSNDSALHGDSYAANVGGTWHGFSVDGVYTVQHDAVSAGRYGVGRCGVAGTPSCNTLSVTIVNSEAWTIAGKYAFDTAGVTAGALKGRLTFYGGYQFIRVSDPSQPLSVGDTTMGGYVFGSVNNTAYLYQDKDLQIGWGGAKYETGPWSFTAAYYRVDQGFYKTSSTSTSCSSAAASNCSGVINTASLIIDYTFDKHFDVYGGIVWSNLVGGFANGYPTTANTAVATGLRLRF